MMCFVSMRAITASGWTERKSELQESTRAVKSAGRQWQYFRESVNVSWSDARTLFHQGLWSSRWMLKGFTFAPLPSARGRRKEDEKQKEMKACQRAAGEGEFICK